MRWIYKKNCKSNGEVELPKTCQPGKQARGTICSDQTGQVAVVSLFSG
jgi:hypothetical protein